MAGKERDNDRMKTKRKAMGQRPSDFDEDMCKKAPTYLKWMSLGNGETLRYACREFVKGCVEDDERLLRRIMIARRNNVKNHQMLKEVTQEQLPKKECYKQSDAQVVKEMDHKAVEQTRTFQEWKKAPAGFYLSYNLTQYIKGRHGHEWLLKKNIWRRMRYRRQNKQLLQEYQKRQKTDSPSQESTESTTRVYEEPVKPINKVNNKETKKSSLKNNANKKIAHNHLLLQQKQKKRKKIDPESTKISSSINNNLHRKKDSPNKQAKPIDIDKSYISPKIRNKNSNEKTLKGLSDKS